MDLTVEKLLKLQAYKEAKVVAGMGGLKKIVTGVTIMEDTTIKEWLREGELLVTSLLPVKDLTRIEMAEFFDSLLDKNLSGVIIKIGKHVEHIPQELIRWGDANDISIIEIPRHILYTDVMYPTMSEVLEKKVNQLAYFKSIHEKFRDMAIKDYSIKKVLDTLSKIIDNPVEIYDKNYNLILSTFRDTRDTNIKKIDSYRFNLKNGYKYSNIDIEGKSVNQVIIEISSIENTKVYLSVVELNKQVGEMDFLAIENGCTNIALSMTKNIAVKEVEERFMNDVVNDILFRTENVNDVILERANISGIDLYGNYFVALLNISFSIDSIKYNLKKELGRLVKKYNGIYSLRNDNIIIFIKENEENDNKILLDGFKEDLKDLNHFILENSNDTGFIAGIGRKATGYKEFIKSYEQALDAIKIGVGLKNDTIIFDYDQLGSFKLISDISKTNDVNNYIPLSLISLMEIDKSKNSELFKTLETFIRNNNHIKNTARDLFIHPKTVSYRLEQIKEIGIDLEDANQLFEIQIGLKILDFLNSK